MSHGTTTSTTTTSTGMGMVFTLSYRGIPILFEAWTPKDNGAFVGSWFAIFFLAMFFRSLLWMRSVFETRWASHWYGKYGSTALLVQDQNSSIDGVDKVEEKRTRTSIMRLDKQSSSYAPFRLQVEIPRMLLVFVTVIMGYVMMLIVMTYVVGYFFAVCTGLAIAELIFGRLSHKYGEVRGVTSEGGVPICCV